MNKLQEFRSKAKSLPDLLNYAALIEPGTVLCKSGALLAGFFFRGDDHASSTAANKNYAAHAVNDALKSLGSGWTSWTETVRYRAPGYYPADTSHFTKEVPKLIEAERRETFTGQNVFKSENILILQYLPPMRPELKAGSKMKTVSEMVIEGDDVDDDTVQERILAEFNKALKDTEDRLGNAVMIRRMGRYDGVDDFGGEYVADELVNTLRCIVSGESMEVALPECGMYMDSWLFGEDLYAGTTPRLGDKFIGVIGIEGFPARSYPSILSMLNEMALPYRWSNRFIHLDRHEAEFALGRYVSKWKQKIRGFVAQMTNKQGSINTDALSMTQQAESAVNEVRSGDSAYGYYTSCIVLMHEDPAWVAAKARLVQKALRRIRFAGRIESINCMEAWLGSIAGHAHANVRRPLISTRNLSHLMPLSAPWAGLATNPCDLYPKGSPPLMMTATTGSTPFNLNLHVSDVGHTLIFGPTGGGKSTLLATIAAQFQRYPNSSVMAFDKGRSLLPLALGMGMHYDIGSEEGGPQFCPLQHLENAADIAWAQEFIEMCYSLQAGEDMVPTQKQAVYEALLSLQKKDHRSLTDFVSDLPEDLRAALNYYTISGPMGYLLDAQTDGLKDTPFNVIEVDELMKLGDKASLPVLRYLFRRFEKSLKGQPAMLILDEAWMALGNPVFKAALKMWLKELRKANCAVVLATQSLSDAANSGILDVLRESCPTKIFLPNKDALQDTALYKSFGLNEQEIKLISKAKPKAEYYYKSALGSRVFNLRLGRLALAFTAASDKVSIARIRALHKQHGTGWHRHWLAENEIDYHKYLNERGEAA
uniref:Putative mating pair formation protein n=1 Tax=Stenotrophomonas maltophilia TaxID=40324 RepID=Q7WZM0_STEMA|nr:putative mating pair formation protein [Stenotrophomonas maltophilia]